MGKVVRISDFINKWNEVFVHDGEHSTLQVYRNDGTGELEIVQMNNEGEAIRTCLSTVDSACLIEAIQLISRKRGA